MDDFGNELQFFGPQSLSNLEYINAYNTYLLKFIQTYINTYSFIPLNEHYFLRSVRKVNFVRIFSACTPSQSLYIRKYINTYTYNKTVAARLKKRQAARPMKRLERRDLRSYRRRDLRKYFWYFAKSRMSHRFILSRAVLELKNFQSRRSRHYLRSRRFRRCFELRRSRWFFLSRDDLQLPSFSLAGLELQVKVAPV